MRWRQDSRTAGAIAMRAAISRSRSLLRQRLSSAASRVIAGASLAMIFNVFRVLVTTLCMALGAAAFGSTESDEAVLGAYDAYRAGDALRYARYAKKLDDHLLGPWIDYWRLSMRLEDVPVAEVREFLREQRNTYVAELLRGEWLKVLGKRGDWDEFEREQALYAREDLEIQCYGALLAAQREDPNAFEGAMEWMWLEPRELPEGCAKLADRMLQDGRISVSDIWLRVRELFEAGQITAAKTALGYLSRAQAPDERILPQAARPPQRPPQRPPSSLDRRSVRAPAAPPVLRY